MIGSVSRRAAVASQAFLRHPGKWNNVMSLSRGFCVAGTTGTPTESQKSDKEQMRRPESSLFELGNEGREEFLTAEQMYTYKEKTFVDYVRLHAYGGKGGIGCATYEDTRIGVRGRASGGSGGTGGSVWIRADISEPDLSYLRTKVTIPLIASTSQGTQADPEEQTLEMEQMARMCTSLYRSVLVFLS